MNVELTDEELAVAIESLRYSKRAVADAKGTPYEVRQANLRGIDELLAKLSSAKTRSEPIR